jgi:hypothetical protein
MLAQVPDNIGRIVPSPGVGSTDLADTTSHYLQLDTERHGIYCVEAVQQREVSLRKHWPTTSWADTVNWDCSA